MVIDPVIGCTPQSLHTYSHRTKNNFKKPGVPHVGACKAPGSKIADQSWDRTYKSKGTNHLTYTTDTNFEVLLSI